MKEIIFVLRVLMKESLTICALNRKSEIARDILLQIVWRGEERPMAIRHVYANNSN